LFDSRAAIEAADAVAEAMAEELGKDAGWAEAQAASFREMAATYVVESG
jgi:glycerol-3-phosphate dehydrogenase